jgi:hypothetical protein
MALRRFQAPFASRQNPKLSFDFIETELLRMFRRSPAPDAILRNTAPVRKAKKWLNLEIFP